MRWILRYILAIPFQFIIQPAPAHAEDQAVVFYYDKNHSPVTRLDRLPELTPALKALLALYALENGAGCAGKDNSGRVKCDMTQKLGLGSNCSEAHIQFVRSWFDVTPNLTSRWHERWNANTKKPGSLEALCYGQPDTANWHNIWTNIKVKATGNTVYMEAILFWGSQYGQGHVRYRSSYEIGTHTITETSSEREELDSSTEGIFGGENG